MLKIRIFIGEKLFPFVTSNNTRLSILVSRDSLKLIFIKNRSHHDKTTDQSCVVKRKQEAVEYARTRQNTNSKG
jgi:hypothetical protein